jgi:hypothetical protein
MVGELTHNDGLRILSSWPRIVSGIKSEETASAGQWLQARKAKNMLGELEEKFT